MSKIDPDLEAAQARAEAARRAAEAARKAAEAAAAAAAKAAAERAAAALKSRVTQRTDELSTGRGGALRRHTATRLPTALSATAPVATNSGSFKISAFGALAPLSYREPVAQPTPVTPPPTGEPVAKAPGLDLYDVVKTPEGAKALEDAKTVSDTALKQGFAAGQAQLQKLLAADQDPLYQQVLCGQASPGLAHAAVADPSQAAANTHALLTTVPEEWRGTMLSAVLQETPDATARKGIIDASVSDLSSSFKDPESYGLLLHRFDPPEVANEVAEATAGQIAQQVQALAGTDPVKAAQLLEQYVNYAPDEATKQTLIKAAGPAITQLTKTLEDHIKTAQENPPYPADFAGATDVLTSLAHIAKESGADGAKLVADAMAPSIDNRSFEDPSFGFSLLKAAAGNLVIDHADDVLPLFGALSQSLQKDKGAAAYGLDQLITPKATSLLRDAQNGYDDAKGKIDALNKDLNVELANLGPAISDADKQKYIADFRKKHQGDYEKLDAAEEKLGETLSLTGPSLLQSTDPTTAQFALQAAQDAAGTPAGAKGALDFITLVAKNPDSLLYRQLDQVSGGIDDAMVGIRDKCITNLYAKDMQEAGDDTEKAAAALEQQLSGIEGVENNKKLAAGANTIAQGVEALKTGDLDALEKIGMEGGVARALQGAGVILGIAKLAHDPKDVGATEYLKTLAATGAEGADIVSGALNAFNGSIRGLPLAELGEAIEKLGPGLRAATAVLGTVGAFQDFLQSGNSGDLVNAIGGVISTVGAAAEAGLILEGTGIGAPLGIAIQVVGTLVSLIGGAISANQTDDRRRGEERDVLKDLHFTDAQAEGLSTANLDGLKKLHDLGMTPEQLQALASAHPDFFKDPFALQAMAEAATALRVKPEDIPGLFDAAAQNGGFIDDLDRTYEQLHQYPSTLTDQVGLYTGLLQGHDSTNQFIHDHAPWNFDAAGKARLQADADYDRERGDLYGYESLALQLDRNPDPAYRVEIIRRMKEDGALDNSVRLLMQNLGKADTVKASLEAAHDAGVISDDELKSAEKVVDDNA